MLSGAARRETTITDWGRTLVSAACLLLLCACLTGVIALVFGLVAWVGVELVLTMLRVPHNREILWAWLYGASVVLVLAWVAFTWKDGSPRQPEGSAV
jgi:hypothetical protein